MKNLRSKTPLMKSMLTSRDKSIIHSINETFVKYENCGILELFYKQVKRHPEKVAVYFDGKRITFRELDFLTNEVSKVLLNSGIKRNEIIAILMDNSEYMLIAMIGILKAGGCYLPIDGKTPEGRIQYMMENSEVSIVLTTSLVLSRFNGNEAISNYKMIAIDKEYMASEYKKYDIEEHNKINLKRDIEDLSYVIYTSGSTGKPKGVMVQDKAVLNFFYWFYKVCEMDKGEKTIGMFSSFAFDFAVATTIIPILSGTSIYVADKSMINDLKQMLLEIDSNNVNIVKLTPSYFSQLCSVATADKFSLASLKHIVLGGEKVNLDDVKRWLKQYPNHNIIHEYGPTETTVACTYLCVNSSNIEEYQNSLPIGRPIGNMEVYILDKTQKLCPVGRKGELYIGGIGLAKGYRNQPDKTSEAFILNPFENKTSKYLYKTGDIGCYRWDGNIDIFGRIDGQIKVRGYRIELEEVEKRIQNLQCIELAAIVAIKDANEWNTLVCYYTAIDNKVSQSYIKDILKKELPEYMMPSLFYKLEKMPLNENNKINRKELETYYPFKRDCIIDKGFTMPKTQIQQEIANIWMDLLKLDEIGVNDSFFELGGNSLILPKLHYKINEIYPDSISIADFFSYPTIKKISEKIQEQFSDKKINSQEQTENRIENDEIAVIGMACKFPDADNVNMFWKNLIENKCSIKQFPQKRIENLRGAFNQSVDISKLAKAAYLDSIDLFDPNFFNVSPAEAELMDPQQRIFLEIVYETLEDAGYAGDKLLGSDTGVFISDSINLYGNLISEFEGVAIPGNRPAVVAGRIAYNLNFHGPVLNIDTACSSALVALHYACTSLRNGECSQALVGGIDIMLLPNFKANAYLDAGIASPDEIVKAFDKDANGTARGEGGAAILLKPLKKALEDNDQIYCVIKGSAVNHGGLANGITAPNPSSQEQVIRKAIEKSRINPETISYIETHGTGTKLGDVVEVDGLMQAFSNYTDRKQIIPIGSVKTNIGHLNNVAGFASLIKVILSMKHGIIPASLNFRNANPLIPFRESQFYVQNKNSEWKRREGSPLRAGVSSFGMSGTNSHVILEELPIVERQKLEQRLPFILTISAKDKKTLTNLVKKYIVFFENNSDVDMRDVVWTANTGRGHYMYRSVFIFNTKDELINELRNFTTQDQSNRSFYGEVKKNEYGFHLSQNNKFEEGAPIKVTYECQKIAFSKEEIRAIYDEYDCFRNLVHKFDETYQRITKNSLVTYIIEDRSIKDKENLYLEYALLTIMSRFLLKLGIKPNKWHVEGVGVYVALAESKIITDEAALNHLVNNCIENKNDLETELDKIILKCKENKFSDILFNKNSDNLMMSSDSIVIGENTINIGGYNSDKHDISSRNNTSSSYRINCLLEYICNLHVKGHKIIWDAITPIGAKKTSIPTYPFDHKSYWIPRDKQKVLNYNQGHSKLTEYNQEVFEKDDMSSGNFKLTGRVNEIYTDIEKKLAEIWRQVLKIEELDVNENFYNLGNSLLAMKLVATIHKKMGIRFSISKFIKAPTLAKQAVIIAEIIEESLLVENKEIENKEELLIPLTENKNITANIICIPYAGGEANSFIKLANYLPSDLAVYSLQIPRNLKIDSIEGIADFYYEKIKELTLSKPTIFFGYSMGGLIAHRLVWKLEKQGIRPSGLVISSTNPYHILEDNRDKSQKIIQKFNELTDDEIKAKAIELDLIPKEIKDCVEVNQQLDNYKFDMRLVLNYKMKEPYNIQTKSFVFVGEEDALAKIIGQWELILDNLESVIYLLGGHLYINNYPEDTANKLADIAKKLIEKR